jgi:hypothetical protein
MTHENSYLDFTSSKEVPNEINENLLDHMVSSDFNCTTSRTDQFDKK